MTQHSHPSIYVDPLFNPALLAKGDPPPNGGELPPEEEPLDDDLVTEGEGDPPPNGGTAGDPPPNGG